MKRLDSYLASEFSISRQVAQGLITDGKVLLNGAIIRKKSFKVSDGDEVIVDGAEQWELMDSISESANDGDGGISDNKTLPLTHFFRANSGVSESLVPLVSEFRQENRIVFEDSNILVVNKPAGVATIPYHTLRGVALTDVLFDTLDKIDELFIVSRLDIGTTGLLIIAKTEIAYMKLKKAFEKREIHKTYFAIVQGVPSNKSGIIDAPIRRDPFHKFRFWITEGGRPSISIYDVVKEKNIPQFGSVSLLKVQPKTGRTHQIRVHLKSIGHTIVGDRIYDGNKKLFKKLDITRPMLHSKKLEFLHPVSNEPLSFEVDFPKDFKKVF